MKTSLSIFFFVFAIALHAQIDPDLLRNPQLRNDSANMNMDAVYSRPFINIGKTPVAVGGYAEANYQYEGTDGVIEGHNFQMRRVTVFLSSSISKRIKFLTEIEFEDGTKEINIEFASVDVEFAPAFNLRGGIVLNPIGAFNQNHDGPKWEFVDRPVAATQMLPATWSNVGFGIYGKINRGEWSTGYEAYFTNGFDEQIVSNSENKTFLPASKLNPERFEESFNGSPLFTGKFAVKNRKIGEIGLSYMGGVYNKFQEDGLPIDRKRRVDVMAIDFNSIIPFSKTAVTGEYAWVRINLPQGFTQQFGSKQHGGFVDFVQPVLKKRMLGFDDAVLNVAARFEYVDWNQGTFIQTGTEIHDELWAVVPAISFRTTPETVFRVNYRVQRQQDLLGNPPARTGIIQVGLSTYF